MKPTAAPAYFPYAHRTMAEMPAYRLAPGGTMLIKGWWPGVGKHRLEPIPTWSNASRRRLMARYDLSWMRA
jgi:hypothetical protein